MRPYYQDDAVTIYHGDCREVLPELTPVDLLLTDVPYNEVNRPSNGLKVLDRGTADSADFGGPTQFVATVAPTIMGSTYIFCATEQVSPLRAALVADGQTTRACVWHKTNPSPMNGEHLWLSAVELCVFGRRSGAYFDGFCEHPVWTGPSEPRQDHPTAKPEWLMRRLVATSCPPGGAVLDPFMGSGTTLRAAKDLGRKAIGIEISERYCEIAARRMGQEVLAL